MCRCLIRIEENVDPEEAYVAALSSCHMLFYLWIASKKRIGIDSYVDDAVGVMEKVDGKMMVSRVELRPRVVYTDEIPSREAAGEDAPPGARTLLPRQLGEDGCSRKPRRPAPNSLRCRGSRRTPPDPG
jgi:hypothetical protein